MTYDQLEMLEAIVEKGSFKAAAESLHKSQPSLSVAIKKLEDEFGLLLFNREEYRPKLTEQGRAFYQQAKQALSSFRHLGTAAREMSMDKTEPRLTIVVDPLTRFEFVQDIFADCTDRTVATELTLRSEILGAGLRLLLEGEADFAIAPRSEPHDEIESVLFDRLELVPVIAKGAVAKGELGKPEFFLRKPQIVVLENRDAGKDRPLSAAPGARCFVTDHSMKATLIREGFGWGRMAAHEIEDDLRKGRLVRPTAKVAEVLHIELHAMRCPRRPMGPVARQIWKRLRENAMKRRKA